jgi:hypothetical protein
MNQINQIIIYNYNLKLNFPYCFSLFQIPKHFLQVFLLKLSVMKKRAIT